MAEVRHTSPRKGEVGPQGRVGVDAAGRCGRRRSTPTLALPLSGGGKFLNKLARCVLLAALLAFAPAARANTPVIAAASDLQFALADIAEAFQAETGQRVELAFGSSGNFARQIRQGAPYQMYLSADERFVLDLHSDGFTRDEGALYALGRIVIFTPHGSPLEADGNLDDLAAALVEGRVTRFAIANPEHAPYGMAAEQALRHRGLWDAITPTLVLGENVSQAAQFAATGNTQGGIIAYSLALSPRVAARGAFDLIPEAWHAPLRQRMALLDNAGPVAERFYGYLQAPPARDVLRRFGFELPEEESRNIDGPPQPVILRRAGGEPGGPSNHTRVR
jgi:molybdate transport system substrate-binding protein